MSSNFDIQGKKIWYVECARHRAALDMTLELYRATVTKYYEPMSAATELERIGRTGDLSNLPDAIITDLNFDPDGDWNSGDAKAYHNNPIDFANAGEMIPQTIAVHKALRNLPVLVFTGDENALYKKGKYPEVDVEYMLKPTSPPTILEWVERKTNPQKERG